MLLRDYQTPPAAGTGVDGSKGETPCSLLPVVREEEGEREGEREGRGREEGGEREGRGRGEGGEREGREGGEREGRGREEREGRGRGEREGRGRGEGGERGREEREGREGGERGRGEERMRKMKRTPGQKNLCAFSDLFPSHLLQSSLKEHTSSDVALHLSTKNIDTS